jgi:hypothetical protein
LKATENLAGARPNSAGLAWMLVDDALDLQRIECAEQRSDFARVSRQRLRLRDFPEAIDLLERGGFTGHGVNLDFLELRGVGGEHLVLLRGSELARLAVPFVEVDVAAQAERQHQQDQERTSAAHYRRFQ